MFSRDQLKRAATLTKEDFVQLGKCRHPHNRLGSAYQVAFVRLFDRFPQQEPLELIEELLCFSAAQLGLDRTMESISACWNTSAQSNGTVSCSAANISSIGSSSASAVAQKRLILSV
jgi:hypothetical protein